MTKTMLKLLVIGAHPDDADYAAGGLAAKYRAAGHDVKFVSLTNGAAGHHEMGGPQLAERRKREAESAGKIIGAAYEVWDNPDGELIPSLEQRRGVIRLIREYQPDLVLTHRPNDYHPDHRYTSQLVQDAAYMVTVPNICPEVAHLRRDPVIMYLRDDFQRPYPFTPSVVVAIDDVFDTKVSMLACHVSQFYEWLPYNAGLADVPDQAGPRREFLSRWMRQLNGKGEQYRDILAEIYGPEQAERITLIEAFEPCEYGTRPDRSTYRRLFPFLPWVTG